LRYIIVNALHNIDKKDNNNNKDLIRIVGEKKKCSFQGISLEIALKYTPNSKYD
jgi:hypothetical protein